VEGGVVTGLSPSLALSVGMQGQLAHRALDAVSPVLQWGARFADTSPLGAAERDIDIRRMVLSLDACPLRWRPQRSVSAFPCVAVDAGVLRGLGREVSTPRSETGFTASAGLSGHVQWSIGAGFRLGLRASGAVPMPRRDYVFEAPRRTVYSSPWVLGTFGMSIGWAPWE